MKDFSYNLTLLTTTGLSMNKKYPLFFIFAFLFCLTSCWRMPEQGEVSILPTVNNPQVTRNQTGALPHEIGL
jgi:hypothetical protein